jgi:hypothetical protein
MIDTIQTQDTSKSLENFCNVSQILVEAMKNSQNDDYIDIRELTKLPFPDLELFNIRSILEYL